MAFNRRRSNSFPFTAQERKKKIISWGLEITIHFRPFFFSSGKKLKKKKGFCVFFFSERMCPMFKSLSTLIFERHYRFPPMSDLTLEWHFLSFLGLLPIDDTASSVGRKKKFKIIPPLPPSPTATFMLCVLFLLFISWLEWSGRYRLNDQYKHVPEWLILKDSSSFLFFFLFIKTASYNSSSFTIEKRAIPKKKKKGNK